MEEVLVVFRETAEQGVFSTVPSAVLQRFFDSLAAMMGNCTRHIVLESLKTILSFFNRYSENDKNEDIGASSASTCYAHVETKSNRCAFILPATILNLPEPMVRSNPNETAAEEEINNVIREADQQGTHSTFEKKFEM